VSTAAYDRFVAHNHLAERIAHVRADDPESGAAIHQAMATVSIPPDVERAIVQAYERVMPTCSRK
jgi:phosphoenolpyruvate synthase/pyruvate phosphate dikinase